MFEKLLSTYEYDILKLLKIQSDWYPIVSIFKIPDQESARKARPGDPFTFTVDASKTGWGEVAIDVVFENRSIRRTFYVEEIGNRIYQVGFDLYVPHQHWNDWMHSELISLLMI